MKISAPEDPRDSRHSKLKPINLRLWRMVVMQAKMRFEKYPSPASSSWVHRHYVEQGGRFLATDDPRYKKIMKREKDEEDRANRRGGIRKSRKDQDAEDRGSKTSRS